jgi:hypothetical protein
MVPQGAAFVLAEPSGAVIERTCYDRASPQFVAMLRVVDTLLEQTVRLQFPVREAWRSM